MLVQEKTLQGFWKRKRDDDDEIIVISSSRTIRSGGVLLEREAPSEQESGEEGEALIQRARKMRVRTPSPASALLAVPQEVDNPTAPEHNNPVAPEPA